MFFDLLDRFFNRKWINNDYDDLLKYIVGYIFCFLIAYLMAALIKWSIQAPVTDLILDSISDTRIEKGFALERDDDVTEFITQSGDIYARHTDFVVPGSEVYFVFDTRGTDSVNDDIVTHVYKHDYEGVRLGFDPKLNRKNYEHAIVADYTDDGYSVLITDDGNVFEYESPDYGVAQDVYLEFDYGFTLDDRTDDSVLKMFTINEVLEMYSVNEIEGYNGGLYVGI